MRVTNKLELMEHVRANVPGTKIHMVHIPEYGTFGQGQRQENAPRYYRNCFFMVFKVCLARHLCTLAVISSCAEALNMADMVV